MKWIIGILIVLCLWLAFDKYQNFQEEEDRLIAENNKYQADYDKINTDYAGLMAKKEQATESELQNVADSHERTKEQLFPEFIYHCPPGISFSEPEIIPADAFHKEFRRLQYISWF